MGGNRTFSLYSIHNTKERGRQTPTSKCGLLCWVSPRFVLFVQKEVHTSIIQPSHRKAHQCHIITHP